MVKCFQSKYLSQLQKHMLIKILCCDWMNFAHLLTPRSLLLVPRQQNMLAVSPVWAVMLGSHLAGVISVPASGARFCEETDTPLSAPAVRRNEERRINN